MSSSFNLVLSQRSAFMVKKKNQHSQNFFFIYHTILPAPSTIMSKKEKVSVSELLSRLQVFSGKEEHEGVADCAERILRQTPGDESATKAYVVACTKLDQYQKVFDLLHSNPKSQTACPLEYAYALYKLNKHDELAAWANQYPENRGVRHAFAQSLYKTELFEKALIIYRELNTTPTEAENEKFDLSVNERAVLAQGSLNNIKFSSPTPVSEENSNSYDQLFNLATSYIGQGEYLLALETLKNAKIKCQTSDSLSPQDISYELLQILVQASYASFKAGKEDEAQQILKSIDANELDPTLRYIFNTNMAIMNPPEQFSNPNFGLRYIEAGSSYNQILPKLVHAQVQLIKNNRFLLELKTGKDAKKLLHAQINQQVPVSKSLECMTVLNTVKDFSTVDQIKKLSKQFQKSPEDTRLAFTLAQLYTNEKDYNLAAATLAAHVKLLESSDPSTAYSPGYVAALSSLYRVSQKYYNAVDYFEKAVEYWTTFEGQSSVTELMKEASFAFAGFDKNQPEVKAYLEHQYEAKPNDISVVAGLLALGDHDITKKYQNLTSSLTPIRSLVNDVDVDALDKLGAAPLLRKPASGDAYKVTKNKTKTRKPRLPKDYDASKAPDPERWMPKRDRSTWKPKRKDKKNKNITQGGNTDEGLSVSSDNHKGSQASSVVKTKAKSANKKKKKGKK